MVAKFDSIIINRAEPEQNGLLRPDDAFLNTQSRIFTAWPTKLALAPRLAQQVIDALNKLPNQSGWVGGEGRMIMFYAKKGWFINDL